MRTLIIAAIGFGLLIQLLYLSLVGLSSTIAKYDYCYDAVMAAKYDLPKPDFTVSTHSRAKAAGRVCT